jgi:RAQPRD family integrative conjugative element protein
MKKMIASILLSLLPCMIVADDAQMNETLVKMVNQLEAMKPLITQAAQQQTDNPRYKIHFDSWVDAHGILHQGLRDDIEAIQSALIQAINREHQDPRAYQPISGDFVGDDHV